MIQRKNRAIAPIAAGAAILGGLLFAGIAMAQYPAYPQGANGTNPADMTASTTTADQASSSASSTVLPAATPYVPYSGTTSVPVTAPSGAPAPTPANPPAPEVLNIDPSGTALIRGTVQSVGTGSLSIDSWGGTWTIQVSPSTSVIATPGSAQASSSADLSGISPGDFVGVSGTASSDRSMAVAATLVRDWTTMPVSTTGASTNSSSYSNTSGGSSSSAASANGTDAGTGSSGGNSTSTANQPSLQSSTSTGGSTGNQALYTGTASNIGSVGPGSFTLTDSNGNAYSVDTDANSQIWNASRETIPLSSIRSGDSIRLDGSQTGSTTVFASVVRDTSI